MDIQTHFNKYADQSIEHPATTGPNPVLEEVFALAAQHKLHAQLLMPGQMATMDYREDRLRIQLAENNGKWRIKHCLIG